MDEVEKVRKKRSVGEDFAGAGAGERAVRLPPACVMDLEASPFADLDETPPRATTTLLEQLHDLFLTYVVPIPVRARRSAGRPSRLALMTRSSSRIVLLGDGWFGTFWILLLRLRPRRRGWTRRANCADRCTVISGGGR